MDTVPYVLAPSVEKLVADGVISEEQIQKAVMALVEQHMKGAEKKLLCGEFSGFGSAIMQPSRNVVIEPGEVEGTRTRSWRRLSTRARCRGSVIA